MIRAWDYFMRRKGILLLILAVFLTSSILSYNVLRSQATDHPVEYISIQHWGDTDIAIPHTGGDDPIILAVLQPREVTDLTPRLDSEVATESHSGTNVPDPLEVTTELSGDADRLDGEEASSDTTEDDSSANRTDSSAVDESGAPDLDQPAADSAGQDDSMNAEPAAQNPDLPEVKAGNDATDGQDFGYIAFLVVIGLIVAGFGTYFFEQHFWR